MKAKLLATRRLFVVSIISLVTATVLVLSGALYAVNVVRIHTNVSSTKIHELTRDYPAVADYLVSQKKSEAHFVTIANLVKADQQRLLGRALLLAIVPVLVLASLTGYFLARRLLAPVDDAFASKERFLQDAAHEMRNPLAAMLAVVQQARDKNLTKDDQAKALATLERQTGQLVKLNEDLLLLERVRDARDSKLLDVSELLLDVVDSMQPQAKAHKLKILRSVEPHVRARIKDADFVCMARNIIENAIKYSKKDSQRVKVALKKTKYGVLLSVVDNGIGIPMAEHNRIGERFFRAKNVGKIGGTGLGLAIVDALVSSYDGKLDIQSRPGKGTVVTILLRS